MPQLEQAETNSTVINYDEFLNCIKGKNRFHAFEQIQQLDKLDEQARTDLLKYRDYSGNNALILAAKDKSLLVPLLEKISQLSLEDQKVILQPNPSRQDLIKKACFAHNEEEQLKYDALVSHCQEVDYIAVACWAVEFGQPIMQALCSTLYTAEKDKKANIKSVLDSVKDFVDHNPIKQRIEECNKASRWKQEKALHDLGQLLDKYAVSYNEPNQALSGKEVGLERINIFQNMNKYNADPTMIDYCQPLLKHSG